MADYLIERLERMHKNGQDIEADWNAHNAYCVTHRELNELHSDVNNRIRQFRLMFLVWVRAHQKMASDIVSPTEWFNSNDTPSGQFRLGSKTVF